MVRQTILTADSQYSQLDAYLKLHQVKKIFLVCDKRIYDFKINDYLKQLPKRLGIHVVRYSDFQPNPCYESVVAGVQRFHQENSDLILAVGGGSTIDVAKCIKLYSNMDPEKSYLKQVIVPNDIKLFAVPTTAGTGSEATRFAVIYESGVKRSVTHDSCIPEAVLMDSSVLKTLPLYQKKSTMMDALCHGIESYWSVNSVKESREYSHKAIEQIMKYKDSYLANEDEGNAGMLYAANTAGKAINIAQTTAGHGMSYKLASLYSIAHGHGAALCVDKLWLWMLCHLDSCIDIRGKEYLKNIFDQIAKAMGCETGMDGYERFRELMDELELKLPYRDEKDYELLTASVNRERLGNNPVFLGDQEINMLYHQILDS